MDIQVYLEGRWSKLNCGAEFLDIQQQLIEADSVLEPANKKSLKNLPKRTLRDWIVYRAVTKRILNERYQANMSPNLILELIGRENFCKENFPFLYHKPVSQFYSKSNTETKKILVCITGHSQKLNMPIPVFNNLAWKYYDGIAYFYTQSNNFYEGEEDFVKLQIQKLINLTNCSILDVATTSAGGPLGIIIEDDLISGKKLICSPPLLRNKSCAKLLREKDFSTLKNAKILFSSVCSKDSNHYDFIKDILPMDLFEKVVLDVSKNYNLHSTMIYAAHSGILTQFMSS